LQSQQPKILPYLILALLAFTWGSSFILMNLGMKDGAGNKVFSALEVATLRISIAFVVLLPFAVYHLKKIPINKFLPVFCVGLFGNGIPAYLFTIAETKISTSLAGMLNSATPLFAVLIAAGIYKEPVSKKNYIGLLLGFTGAAGLMLAGEKNLQGNLPYAALVLLATVCYAISVNIIRQYLKNINAVAITSVAFLFIGIPGIVVLYSTSFTKTLALNPSGIVSFGYICILAIAGTALAVILFNYLVSMIGAMRASSVTYLIPITAIFWGLIFNEPIHYSKYFFIGIIILGVWLINQTK
jgi:drug/metabolite transporter (DMT)-like permease